ncbi:MAG: helicase-exonuclease AddAB subunit AddA, partial [Clostridiales bacterium]|nr:helicase-exonuclease AddAB subunit AddA [Clostridiales bacterium]
MKWTERQLEAIDKTEGNMLVSAAAGSGKTAVLVERVRRLLVDKGVGLDRMLVVTFTNAAAAEMKERIYKSLSAELISSGADVERKDMLRRQLSLLPSANISTFHKFAMEVVHNYYHVIGIKPNLRICDESRQALLKREAMDELLSSKYEAKDENFLAFADSYAGPGGDEQLRVMVSEFYEALRNIPDPKSWTEHLISESAELVDLYMEFLKDEAESRIDYALESMKEADRLLFDLPNMRAKNAEDISAIESIAAALESVDFAVLKDNYKFVQMRSTNQEKADWEILKDQVTALRNVAKAELRFLKDNYADASCENLKVEQELLRKPLATLISLTEDFAKLYAESKMQLGVLDFSDLEHFALKILKNDEVRREYSEKFEYIFVDEYQDINSIQGELISAVSKGDNVFMVGDVKQCIYKFRNAEPEIFLECYRAYKAGGDGRVVDLSNNFRSKKEIIDFVNYIFEKLMTRDNCGMDYGEDEILVKGSSYEGPISYPPEFYLIDSFVPKEGSEADSDEETESNRGDEPPQDGEDFPEGLIDSEIMEMQSAELEALQAVRIIKKYHGKPIFDDKRQQERPLEYRDMALLMRKTQTWAEIMYKALSDAGIPVYLERDSGYFDTIEIQIFLNLLRIIDNRSRDIPLLSVLRSPVFGFNASQLAAVRIWAGGRGEMRVPYNEAFRSYAQEGPEGELKDRCADFLSKLDRWQLQSSYMPLADFIWQLLRETGYGIFASSVPAGAQRMANLQALADKAAAYESENAGGLYGFIDFIDAVNRGGGKLKAGQVKMLSEADDVVRIMSIHKSKGLEFPFVLVCSIGRELKGDTRKSNLIFHRDFGAAMRLVKPRSGLYYNPLSMKLIERRIEKDQIAEEIRLLYVAFTRARDILVMSGVCRKPEEKLSSVRAIVPRPSHALPRYLEPLLALIPDENIHFVSRSDLAVASGEESSARMQLERYLDEGFDVDESELPVSREEISRRLFFDYSPEERELQKRKYSVSEMAAEQREEASEGFVKEKGRLPDFMDERRLLDAAARGTAYHRVMEYIPFSSEGKDPASVRSFMETLVRENKLSEAEAEAVDERKISAFFSSEIGRQALAAEQLIKEKPFTLRSDYKGRSVLVQGVIDCAFRNDGGWTLADYKTGRLGVGDENARLSVLKNDYGMQIRLY